MKILLKAKPSIIDFCYKYGESALYIASEMGHVEAMKILLEAKPSLVDVCTMKGISPLQIATEMGYAEAIALLENYCKVKDIR